MIRLMDLLDEDLRKWFGKGKWGGADGGAALGAGEGPAGEAGPAGGRRGGDAAAKARRCARGGASAPWVTGGGR